MKHKGEQVVVEKGGINNGVVKLGSAVATQRNGALEAARGALHGIHLHALRILPGALVAAHA